MSSTTAAGAGAWLGGLSSALQGRWTTAASHGEQQRRPQKLGGELNRKAAGKEAEAGAAGRKAPAAKKKGEDDVGRCGGAMSDTTVYLLLDRFAPN